MSDPLETIESCPIHAIRPMSPQLLAYPVAMNRRLREEAPVYQDPDSGIFFISRYDDVVEMSMDYETFSSVMPFAGGSGGALGSASGIRASWAAEGSAAFAKPAAKLAS